MKHRIEYIWAKDQQGKVVAAKKLLSTEKPELVHWLSLSTKLLTIFVACNRYGVWASEAFKLEPRAVRGDPVEPISEYCVLQVPLAASRYLLLPVAAHRCQWLANRCPSMPLAASYPISCFSSFPLVGCCRLLFGCCRVLLMVCACLCLSISSPSLSTVCDHHSSLLLNKHLMNNTVRLWH